MVLQNSMTFHNFPGPVGTLLMSLYYMHTVLQIKRSVKLFLQ